jgi:myo-inositol-1(or 4)-monophosphatase
VLIDALIESCREVHARTRGMAGTAQGNRQMGRGAGGDISRKIDLVAEKTVIAVLKRRKVNATIIGEECGRIEGKEGFIIMDGIDGTANATWGIPFYCCSLAYATEFRLSSVTHAAVMDLVTGDLYHASKGKGAYLNGKRIRTKKEASDEMVVVAGMNVSGIGPDIVAKLSPVMSRVGHARQLGAIALELCLVAAGRLDASIDLRGKVRPTDIAAAFLIVKEAGGQIHCGDDGREMGEEDFGIDTRLSLVATANKKMFDELSIALRWPRAD